MSSSSADFLRRVADHSILTAREEQDIIRRMRAGDVDARDLMIKHNMRLVLSIASPFRYKAQRLEFEDIVQEGVIGLNTAIDKFDPDRGFKFSTYATWWIRQRIQRAVANQDRTIRTPMHISIRRWRAVKYMEENPEATDEEVAAALGIEVRQLSAALDAASVTASLSSERYSTDEGGGGDWGDFFEDTNSPDPLQLVSHEAEMEPLRVALAELDQDQRDVLLLRFGFEGPVHSINQIAEKLGKPAYVISKLQKEAIKSLRDAAKTWYASAEA